jgi:hypothetical protein
LLEREPPPLPPSNPMSPSTDEDDMFELPSDLQLHGGDDDDDSLFKFVPSQYLQFNPTSSTFTADLFPEDSSAKITTQNSSNDLLTDNSRGKMGSNSLFSAPVPNNDLFTGDVVIDNKNILDDLFADTLNSKEQAIASTSVLIKSDVTSYKIKNDTEPINNEIVISSKNKEEPYLEYTPVESKINQKESEQNQIKNDLFAVTSHAEHNISLKEEADDFFSTPHQSTSEVNKEKRIDELYTTKTSDLPDDLFSPTLLENETKKLNFSTSLLATDISPTDDLFNALPSRPNVLDISSKSEPQKSTEPKNKIQAAFHDDLFEDDDLFSGALKTSSVQSHATSTKTASSGAKKQSAGDIFDDIGSEVSCDYNIKS